MVRRGAAIAPMRSRLLFADRADRHIATQVGSCNAQVRRAQRFAPVTTYPIGHLRAGCRCSRIDVCAAAYATANGRGERDQQLLERAVGDNSRHWDVRDAREVAMATAK